MMTRAQLNLHFEGRSKNVFKKVVYISYNKLRPKMAKSNNFPNNNPLNLYQNIRSKHTKIEIQFERIDILYS